MDGTRSSKTEIIQFILDKYNIYPLDDFIMANDRKHDIIGALNTGIDSIGVTFGYGSPEELRDSKPTYMVNSVSELKTILSKS